MAKYRFGSKTIEAVGTYVRVTVHNMCGVQGNDVMVCSRRECPSPVEVAQMVAEMQGCWPDRAILDGCARACADARAEHEASQIRL